VLNRRLLPTGFHAENQVHIGVQLETDVATFDEERPMAKAPTANGGVALKPWAPPVTALVVPARFPDVVEVLVLRSAAGLALVAAIEFVSPGNKDRPETRRDFVAKCATYLQAGVGLIVVDVVTTRHANLHDELMEFLDHPPAFRFPAGAGIYTSAYRPSQPVSGAQIELWLQPLTLGQTLPVMPLALRGGPTLPLDLEATYAEVLLDLRL
jgi:hypothetical protein